MQIPGGVRAETAAVPGSTVQLTLDEDLQFTAQRALAAAVKKAKAESGQIVVLDAKTAEVLAMATAPTYDAQNPGRAEPAHRAQPGGAGAGRARLGQQGGHLLRRPGPGASSARTPRCWCRTATGWPDKVVSDAWSHAPTRWTATGVLAKSSNVGTLMIAHDLVGEQAFYDYERRFGIGEKTGIELPGESPGILPPPEEWSGTTFGNLPIGQGVSMTPLQLAGMYQTIANDGVRVTPRIVKAVVAPDGSVTDDAGADPRPPWCPRRRPGRSGPCWRPWSARAAPRRPRRSTGTGWPARPAPRRSRTRRAAATPAAATGRPSPGSPRRTTPELVISVVIDQGKGGGHGGAVAGPLFKEVMSYALTARKVAPTGTPRPTQKLTVD